MFLLYEDSLKFIVETVNLSLHTCCYFLVILVNSRQLWILVLCLCLQLRILQTELSYNLILLRQTMSEIVHNILQVLVLKFKRRVRGPKFRMISQQFLMFSKKKIMIDEVLPICAKTKELLEVCCECRYCLFIYNNLWLLIFYGHKIFWVLINSRFIYCHATTINHFNVCLNYYRLIIVTCDWLLENSLKSFLVKHCKKELGKLEDCKQASYFCKGLNYILRFPCYLFVNWRESSTENCFILVLIFCYILICFAQNKLFCVTIKDFHPKNIIRCFITSQLKFFKQIFSLVKYICFYILIKESTCCDDTASVTEKCI